MFPHPHTTRIQTSLSVHADCFRLCQTLLPFHESRLPVPRFCSISPKLPALARAHGTSPTQYRQCHLLACDTNPSHQPGPAADRLDKPPGPSGGTARMARCQIPLESDPQGTPSALFQLGWKSWEQSGPYGVPRTRSVTSATSPCAITECRSSLQLLVDQLGNPHTVLSHRKVKDK